jgi:hypothetical protein
MNRSQSGNVLFYILIAVGLLAALSYAVSQGNRGGATQISDERAGLYAGEIIEYANILSAAVAQLRLRGVDTASLCFDHSEWGASDYNHAGCGDDFNKIYNLSGAGIEWTNAPAEAMDTAATPDNLWHFYGDNEIELVGTTEGNATSSDLIILVDELSLPVCQKINEMLGVTAANTTPPTDTAYGTTRYIGAFGFTATIGDEDAVLEGKPAACFQNTTTSEYAFYKVLIAR